MPFFIKQGDRRPLFVVILKDDFGEPTEGIVNLSSATSAVFNMRASTGGQAVKVSRGTATISNPTAGEVTYPWASADTDTSGNYVAEVEVTWSDGKVETFPNNGYFEITVTDDIA